MHVLNTVTNYVAGAKTLHELLELDTQGFQGVRVKLMWMGLNNDWKEVVKRAAPIDPEVLCHIRGELDLDSEKDLVFWSLCLMAFFILARKSNLVPTGKFDPQKQMCAKHVNFTKNKVQFTLHWSKT